MQVAHTQANPLSSLPPSLPTNVSPAPSENARPGHEDCWRVRLPPPPSPPPPLPPSLEEEEEKEEATEEDEEGSRSSSPSPILRNSAGAGEGKKEEGKEKRRGDRREEGVTRPMEEDGPETRRCAPEGGRMEGGREGGRG